MKAPDLTVVITAHAEGILAGPTVMSANAAILAAESRGYSIERVIALDRPTAETEAFFAQQLLSNWRITQHDFGDPFQNRNAAALSSHGQNIAFVDGDDLVSENWFWRAMDLLSEESSDSAPVVIHPELNWIFDGHNSVFNKRSQDDELFVSHYFYFDNYYDMMSVARRHLVLEFPYASRDLDGGFGYQDWEWNLETMAAGVVHKVARDTVVFKRRREDSVSTQNRRRKCVVRFVEGMAIDRVRSLSEPREGAKAKRQELG